MSNQLRFCLTHLPQIHINRKPRASDRARRIEGRQETAAGAGSDTAAGSADAARPELRGLDGRPGRQNWDSWFNGSKRRGIPQNTATKRLGSPLGRQNTHVPLWLNKEEPRQNAATQRVGSLLGQTNTQRPPLFSRGGKKKTSARARFSEATFHPCDPPPAKSG